MNTRALGVLAIVAGPIWGTLFVLFIPFRRHRVDRKLASSACSILVVAIAFSAAALGLAWRFADHVGALGVIGAILVTLGAVMSLVGFIVCSPSGRPCWCGISRASASSRGPLRSPTLPARSPWSSHRPAIRRR